MNEALGVDVPRLRPHCGRVLVSPSTVDETARPSGLVVPLQFEGDDGCLRGVVVAVDETGLGVVHNLTAGMVVYYRGGIRLAGLVILEQPEILAYEEPEL